MSLIGACVYYFDPTVGRKLTLLQPHFVVVGSGAWNDVDAIAGACAPVQPLIIMRDMSENLIDQVPEVVMDRMAVVAAQRFYKKVAFHLLSEDYEGNVLKAKSWELRAISFAQAPTVALNFSFGKDPDLRYKEVAEASKYIGPHLYDGWLEGDEIPTWVDRVYTSRRYEGNWLKDYRHKIISTEVGVERHPATGQRRGWHDMSIPEETVRLRMLANSLHWKADGLLGVCWFTAGHTEASWNEGYGMTEGMAKLWGEKGPLPTIGGNAPVVTPTPPVPPNGGIDTMPTLDDVAETFLEIQRVADKAKSPNATFEEQGRELDLIPKLAGDGFNLVTEIKKANV